MTSIRFQVTVDGVDELAAALARAADSLPGKLSPVIEDYAGKIRDGMRADMAGSGHFGSAAGSIGYDMRGKLAAEIGPTKPAGAIANIAYFGGANGGGGTVRDPIEPAQENAGAFAQALADVIESVLG